MPSSRKSLSVIILLTLVFALMMWMCTLIWAQGADNNKPYTGLIIDARGLQMCRSMSPRVVNEFAATVWDLGVRDIKVFNANTYYGFFEKLNDEQMDFCQCRGIVSYAKDASETCVKDRCGSNPLVIKGIRKAHSAEDWVVISRDDGKAILEADKQGNFTKDFKVAFLID
jgi:hypothetical protein